MAASCTLRAIAPQVYGDYDETIDFLRGRGLLAHAQTCSK